MGTGAPISGSASAYPRWSRGGGGVCHRRDQNVTLLAGRRRRVGTCEHSPRQGVRLPRTWWALDEDDWLIEASCDDLPLPLYGDGGNIRDWLFVDDHCAAIDFLIERGENGEVYNVGGGNERENREITRKILEITGKPDSLIKPVADRQGHDRRYSLDSTKLAGLGFVCDSDFDDALRRTVQWYIDNEPWWRVIKDRSAEFREYYARQYGGR